MDAVNYLKTKEEMCTSSECRHCPLGRMNNNRNKSCEEIISLYPDEAVAIVEMWGKNHPDIISIHYLAEEGYTSNITEAKNFFEGDYGEYWEKEEK